MICSFWWLVEEDYQANLLVDTKNDGISCHMAVVAANDE